MDTERGLSDEISALEHRENITTSKCGSELRMRRAVPMGEFGEDFDTKSVPPS